MTQVTLIVGGSATFSYDDNGNLIGGSTLSGVYDHANLPWSVQRSGSGGGFDRFAYGPDGQRTWHLDSAGVQTWYGEAGYEKVRRGGVVEHRHTLPGTIITVKQGQSEITHTHGDRLGSIVLMTDSDGAVKRDGQGQEMRRSYDAFGLVRQGNLSNRPGGTLNLDPPQNRGFTGHEHLDTTRLIHMNGRTYDPLLGRFMGVDPIIQAPANSQSLNPYSYILNNPLAGTDPTGYTACGDVDIKGESKGKGSCDHKLESGEVVSVNYRITSRGVSISATPSTINAIALDNAARNQSSDGHVKDSNAPIHSKEHLSNASLATLQENYNSLNSRDKKRIESQCSNYRNSSCSVSDSDLENAAANPVGVNDPDGTLRNAVVGAEVSSSEGLFNVSMTYSLDGFSEKDGSRLIGDTASAWSSHGNLLDLRLATSPSDAQVTFKNVGLQEIAYAVGLCSCRFAALIGGFSDNANKTILINGQVHRAAALPFTGAHEFGHFIGLSHRYSGIMSYSHDRAVNENDAVRFRKVFGGQ